MWQEVAPDCFRRRYERYDVNVGVVRGADGLLVFDTRGSPVQGAQLVDELAQLGPHRVRHVVNSHWHFDHVLGNQCFAGRGATRPRMWAHPECIELVRRQGTRLLLGACTYDPELDRELASVTLVPADHEVHDRVVVDLGDRAVELVYHGRGHTGHDVVAYVADAGVVFAGDLLEQSAPPVYGDDSYPIAWPAAVAALCDRGMPVVVPGHGDVMGAAEAAEQAAAIARVARTIAALHRAGEPAERALAAGDAGWPFPPELLAAAVWRGYEELAGTAR